MIYAVSISHEVEADLRSIYAYIKFNLMSVKNAQEQVNRLEKMVLSLDEFPMRHRLVGFAPWKSRGLRFMVCDNFLVFYFVCEEKHQVVISRILYGKRDIEKALYE